MSDLRFLIAASLMWAFAFPASAQWIDPPPAMREPALPWTTTIEQRVVCAKGTVIDIRADGVLERFTRLTHYRVDGVPLDKAELAKINDMLQLFPALSGLRLLCGDDYESLTIYGGGGTQDRVEISMDRNRPVSVQRIPGIATPRSP